MKRRCAKKALEMIKDGMIVGLGGGETISYLCEYIHDKNLDIKIVTPSKNTLDLCHQYHFNVLDLEYVDHVDIAFDGCDMVNDKFIALKSGGGIHVKEKIIAKCADNYVLLIDESKYHDLPLNPKITIEVLPSARSYVKKELLKLNATLTERHSKEKAGLTISDDGNYLIEAVFNNITDYHKLASDLNIMGIVGHALFENEADTIVIATENDFIIRQKTL